MFFFFFPRPFVSSNHVCCYWEIIKSYLLALELTRLFAVSSSRFTGFTRTITRCVLTLQVTRKKKLFVRLWMVILGSVNTEMQRESVLFLMSSA